MKRFQKYSSFMAAYNSYNRLSQYKEGEESNQFGMNSASEIDMGFGYLFDPVHL